MIQSLLESQPSVQPKSQLEIVAYHGWGYDATCWRAWSALFSSSNNHLQVSFRAFDRGYFGNPQQPEFSADAIKIIFTHSFGLHLCPVVQLQQADLTVIFGGFIEFHPTQLAWRRRSQQTVQQMIKQLETEPQSVLQKFRIRCGQQNVDTLPEQSDTALLLHDLRDLNHAQFEYLTLLQKPVIVLHGSADRIVPAAQGRIIAEKLPDCRYFELDADHISLIAQPQICWSIIQPEIEVLDTQKIYDKTSLTSQIVGTQSDHDLPSSLRENLPSALPPPETTDILKTIPEMQSNADGHRKIVARNFGQAAKAYNLRAKLQKDCAQHLQKLMLNYQPPDGTILEIGCGTGFITQALLELFPQRHLQITDLSTEMLEFCRSNLLLSDTQKALVQFQQMDGERIIDFDSCAAIVSGFTVQWFTDLQKTLCCWLQKLKPGGYIFLSFPTCHSFPEWRQMCNQLRLAYTANPLPDFDLLLSHLPSEAKICHAETLDLITTHNSAADFFRDLKAIGAATSQKQLTPTQMRQLIRVWDAQADKIQVHHQIAFWVIQRFWV